MTSANTNNDGAGIRSDGLIHAKRANVVATFNRKTSDGSIVELAKDNTVVGSIVTRSGDLAIGTGNTGLRFSDADRTIYPFDSTVPNEPPAVISLGDAGSTFKNLYLSGGVFLGGTGSANKISDYETGSWSPSGATGFPGGGAPQSITATYTKVGDTVSVRAIFNAYNDGTNLNISGLPFAASANSAASISISTGKSFVNERVSGSSFYCTISGTDTSLRTFYLEATYRTAS
jgi:hypothetical protein